MRKGEIWRVRLPRAAGHVQAGERPAIIIQEDRFTAVLPTVLIVPLTGTPGATRFPGTLEINPDAQNGLTMRSVALVFQTRPVDKRDMVQRLGVVDSVTLDHVLALLKDLTG
jgi:mRNA-degrading endonuclease toxin of MazEF toxin-antitoxin module